MHAYRCRGGAARCWSVLAFVFGPLGPILRRLIHSTRTSGVSRSPTNLAASLTVRGCAHPGPLLRDRHRALPRRGEGGLLRALLLDVRPGRREDRADALRPDALDLRH